MRPVQIQHGCGQEVRTPSSLSKVCTLAGCGMTLAPTLSASCGARGASLPLPLAGTSSRSTTACGAVQAVSAARRPFCCTQGLLKWHLVDNKKGKAGAGYNTRAECKSAHLLRKL